MRLFIPLLTRSSNHDNRFVSLAQMLDLPFSEDLMQLVSTALEDMDDAWTWTMHRLAASLPQTRAVWTRDNLQANRVSLLAHWRGSTV